MQRARENARQEGEGPRRRRNRMQAPRRMHNDDDEEEEEDFEGRNSFFLCRYHLDFVNKYIFMVNGLNLGLSVIHLV